MSEIVEQSSLYKEKYGAWAGMPAGNKPDFKRCCEEVRSSERWSHHHQCARPRGYGPDKAYCKQHDPEVVKARDASNRARANEKWNKLRYEFYGKTFFNALKEIAEGHNDARGLAQKTIDEFKAGEHK